MVIERAKRELVAGALALVVLGAVPLLATVTGSPAWVALAASCSGGSHQMQVASGGASPGSGTTATTFKFSVTYVDNAGCDPTRIRVTIVGVGTFGLSRDGSTAQGPRYSRTMKLPVGTWSYRFDAQSGSGNGRRSATLTNVSPSAVKVGPAPT